jgi:hypothetical protein
VGNPENMAGQAVKHTRCTRNRQRMLVPRYSTEPVTQQHGKQTYDPDVVAEENAAGGRDCRGEPSCGGVARALPRHGHGLHMMGE